MRKWFERAMQRHLSARYTTARSVFVAHVRGHSPVDFLLSLLLPSAFGFLLLYCCGDRQLTSRLRRQMRALVNQHWGDHARVLRGETWEEGEDERYRTTVERVSVLSFDNHTVV